jgi:hypothetical protein
MKRHNGLLNRRSTYCSLLIGLAVPSLTAAASPFADDIIDRSDTKKLLRTAEARMTEHRLSNPLPKPRPKDPVAHVDNDSPLLKKTCTFRVKLVKIAEQPSEEGKPAMQTIVGTMRTHHIRELYDYNKFYRLHGGVKRHYEDEVKALKHEIELQLAPDQVMPAKMPKDFKVLARVAKVTWDTRDALPVLQIRAELVSSKDLRIP